MTVLQRVATIATVTFVLAGLIGTSTPGLAFELDRTSIVSATLPTNSTNALNPITVPAPSPSTEVVQPLPSEAGTDDADFNSLNDAVAAQDAEVADADESLRCLASAIYFESKGEPLSGQLAVAEVIINRTKSGTFPSDLCSVVKQRGQFGFVRGGQIPAVDSGRATFKTALAVAKVALADSWDSPAAQALYFHARRVSPAWGKTRVASIGNHIFYR